MKNMITALMVFGLFLSTTFSQEENKYGLGFEFHTLPTAMAQSTGSNLGVLFSIKEGSFLFEPLIIYSSSTTTIDYSISSYEDTETTISDLTFLLGIFKTNKREKIRSYYGLRVGQNWYKEDYEGTDSDEDLEYLIIAPTIGAEYFVSDNFSFGGEGMYAMVSNNFDEQTYSSTTKQQTIIPRFIVRFYY